MIYTEKSCKKFIEAAASKEPVPGGGSVAALAGALGTSLGHMVGALTVGKKKYADVEDEMMELMKEGRQLQRELLDLVQADIDMFEPLSQLYSLKPETDEEIAEKERLMEEALENARDVIGDTPVVLDHLFHGFLYCGDDKAVSFTKNRKNHLAGPCMIDTKIRKCF